MNKITFAIGIIVLLLSLNSSAQTSKVLIDNEKVRVTEYLSEPGQEVCGKGQHTHTDHLTILLTDAKVQTTHPNGQSQAETFLAGKHLYTVTKNGKAENIPAEGAFWAKGETHAVKNTGDKPLRFYIVETK